MPTSRLKSITLAIAGALLLAACAQTPRPTPPPQTPPASPVAANFAIDQDFPDPDVLFADGAYYAYATNRAEANVQVATSNDLAAWTIGDDALPTLPAWAEPGNTWAPDVSGPIDRRYVMFFTARDKASGRQCIGSATSGKPTGPFAPTSRKPLICPVQEGGAIDPTTFTAADGTRYLVWKTDGNCCGLSTWIELAPLRPDGLTLAGPAVRLLQQTEEWEGQLVEAPTLLEHEGRFVLFYSANAYVADDYAVGYAVADDLRGPYTKQEGPFFSTELSQGAYRGPGGQDVVATAGGDVLIFHSWDATYTYRGLNTLPLTWRDGLPTIGR